jgi:hypothetical protein
LHHSLFYHFLAFGDPESRAQKAKLTVQSPGGGVAEANLKQLILLSHIVIINVSYVELGYSYKINIFGLEQHLHD